MTKPLYALLLSVGLIFSGCATHSCRTQLAVPCVSNFKKLNFCGPSQHDYPVYRTPRKGPPVLVLHELNGLSAGPLDFAVELGNHGWTVYAPALFGEYGDSRPIAALGDLKRDTRWKLYDPHDSGPVLDDVAAMVGWISRQHRGQRVIVMGNCLTGGFPLALLGRRDVKAAILCQPALPLTTFWQAIFKNQPEPLRSHMGLPPRDEQAAFAAMKRDGSKVLLGFHYLEDPVAPIEKFDRLHAQLREAGLEDRFRPVVLVPVEKGRREAWWEVHFTAVRRGFAKPHNTVTESGSETDRRAMRQRLRQQLEALRGT